MYFLFSLGACLLIFSEFSKLSDSFVHHLILFQGIFILLDSTIWVKDGYSVWGSNMDIATQCVIKCLSTGR